jgi:hypothetical protein
MSGGGGSGIRGYWYFLGLHMGIGRGPINSVVEMRVGDKTLVNIEIAGDAVFPIYRPDLFGGEDAEGGVGGACYVMMGGPTQEAPLALRTMIGGGIIPAVLPGFRRMATIFFDGFIAAINPYPKPWKFRVRRTTAGWDGAPWYPEKCLIELTRPWTLAEITSSPMIHAMNPAHIFYEVMTNREWGRGLPRAAMDDANLRAVADALHAEGFGLCLRWTRSDSIETFVQSILDHIGAVMRPNLVTGELQLKLLRDDYVFADLPLFTNESGLLDITEASVAATPTIINHVRVNFNDPITGKAASVGTHNLAGVQGSDGEINTQVKDYPGLCTPDLAARVALRDLRLSSNSLRRFTLTLDRRGADVRPGDVIRIQDPTRMIPDMAVRVGRFEDGPMTDGRIRITAVQDVFSLSAASYIGNQPPSWEAPNTTPCIGYNRSFEIPYFMLARMMSKADLDYLDDDEGRLGEVVELGGRPMNSGYRLAVRNGAPTEEDIPDADTDYCPTVPAHWDGGDCVRVVVGEGGVVINVAPAWSPMPDPDYGDITLYMHGTVVSPDGLTLSTADGPVSAPQYVDISGGSENYLFSDQSLRVEFNEGSNPELTPTMPLRLYNGTTLVYSSTLYRAGGTFPGFPDVAVYFERPVADIAVVPWPEFPATHSTVPSNPMAPFVGESLRMELGDVPERVVEACCVCLEIRMHGAPVSAGLPYQHFVTDGVIDTPSSLTPSPLTPSWGSPYVSEEEGVYNYSDTSLVFGFQPDTSPFLTNVMTCKVYDDDDGGALVYETVLYRPDAITSGSTAPYYERPMASWPADIQATYPLLHTSPPSNPAVALAGHNLRFVLNTASACCGGLPSSCNGYYEFTDRDVDSRAGAILVMRSIGSLVTGLRDAHDGGTSCSTILGFIPTYVTQFNLPQVGYVEDGSVVTLSTFVPGNGESNTSDYTQNLILEIDDVNYGWWTCNFAADGTLLSFVDNTTYGPTVQIGGVGGAAEMTIFPGALAKGGYFPNQHVLTDISDHEAWLTCIIPACAIEL